MAPSAPVLLSVSLLFLTSHASPDSSFYLSDIVNHVTKSHHVLNSFLKNPSHLQKWTSLLDSAKGQSIGLFTNLAASDFTTNTDQNISALCIDHIMLTMQSLKTGNAQALQMLDSQGKIPSGILLLNTKWLGMYSECKSVNFEVPVTDSQSSASEMQHLYQGKYCSADLLTPVLQGLPVTLGLCVPDSCHEVDVHAFISTILRLIGSNTTSVNVRCPPVERPPLDGPAIFVVSILAIIAALVCTSTLYDVFIYQPRLHPPPEFLYPAVIQNGPAVDENHPSINPEAESQQDNLSSEPRTTLDVTEYTPILKRQPSAAEEHAKVVQAQTGRPMKCLLAFSAYTNGLKLVNMKPSSEHELGCIHGIRLLSMSWVLLGHSFGFPLQVAQNMLTFLSWTSTFAFQAVLNASVSVDSFFFLSGTLVSYLMLRELKKCQGPRNMSWPLFYFHRFWRLTPSYMILLGFLTAVFPFMGEGPLWSTDAVVGTCRTAWWTNLLYVNNLVNSGIGCFGWTWYLANDMQFFIIAPIFVVTLFWKSIVGIVLCIVAIAVSCISTGLITYINNYPSDFPVIVANLTMMQEQADFFEHTYIAPWCRLGAYVVGILCGFALYKTSSSFRMHWSLVIAGWASAAAVALSVIYGLLHVAQGHMFSWEANAAYAALHRVAWAVALAWVVFACCRGYGGPVNAFLSWRMLVPFSRLTYMAYLIHPIVIFYYMLTLEQTFFISYANLIWFYLGTLFITYACAVVTSLSLEAPLIALEKIILHRKSG